MPSISTFTRPALVSVSLLALAACAPNLGAAPRLTAPGALASTRTFDATGGGVTTAEWPSDTWWVAYGDPQLTKLIEEALTSSPDLQGAAARVRIANAQAEVAGAPLFPALAPSFSSGQTKQSLSQYPDNFRQFLPKGYHSNTRLALDLTYQLDFFGKNRAALAAATSNARAAEADYASARLTLSTGVAEAYADLLRYYADRDAAAEAVKVRSATLDLVSQRLKNGLETRGEFSQERATAAAAQADVDKADLAIAQTRHRLAALLGAGPDRGIDISRPASPVVRAPALPTNLAVDLIGRRPDILAARLRADAAAARTRAAKADFYPNIDLVGYVGQQSLDIGSIFQKASQIGQINAALRLPNYLVGGAQLRGTYRGARAEYDQAVFSYNQTLANALREVADALAGRRSLDVQLKDAREALAASEDAYAVARERYQGGLSPYLNVLTAENQVLTQRRNVADLDAQALALDVTLVRALGGGFRAG